MIARSFQILVGYALACLAAGLALSIFSTAPADPSGFVSEWTGDRLQSTLRLALSAATHIALYIAPIALVAIVISELGGLRGWLYMLFAGLGISICAFIAQYSAEAPTGATIMNNFALTAFIVAGLCAGLVYWLFAGGPTGSKPNKDIAAIEKAVDEKKSAPTVVKTTTPFAIKTTGKTNKVHHLVASQELNEDDFYAIAEQLGREPVKARKIGFVAARQAEEEEKVETLWNGSETSNTAHRGDWIVTNLNPAREVIRDKSGNENTYVISAKKFPKLYDETEDENEFGQIYKAKSVVEAIFLSGGFEIIAPWGQKQFADVGYLLSNNGDIYGNNVQTFKKTYEVLD